MNPSERRNSMENPFDAIIYGPVFSLFLKKRRLNPLDPGRPNIGVRPALEMLTMEKAFVNQLITDSEMAEGCISGTWLYHNFLEDSHKLSQSIDTPTGSYWHGIMHRREPDFSNSKYWFRKVGIHPVFEALQRDAASLARGQDTSALFLVEQGTWDPFAFVDLCEACLSGQSSDKMLCREIQQREWELLFEYSFQKAIGK